MIRKATLDDLDRIMEIKADAVNTMKADNNNQWDENHPTKISFQNHISNGDLYVYEIDQRIYGMICITENEDDEYKPVNWSATGKQIIIHRLAIAKEGIGRGIAIELMEYAIDFAHEQKAVIIKIDTFTKNKRAQQLFTKMGFKYVADIHFPQRSEPYHCYEMVL